MFINYVLIRTLLLIAGISTLSLAHEANETNLPFCQISRYVAKYQTDQLEKAAKKAYQYYQLAVEEADKSEWLNMHGSDCKILVHNPDLTTIQGTGTLVINPETGITCVVTADHLITKLLNPDNEKDPVYFQKDDSFKVLKIPSVTVHFKKVYPNTNGLLRLKYIFPTHQEINVTKVISCDRLAKMGEFKSMEGHNVDIAFLYLSHLPKHIKPARFGDDTKDLGAEKINGIECSLTGYGDTVSEDSPHHPISFINNCPDEPALKRQLVYPVFYENPFFNIFPNKGYGKAYKQTYANDIYHINNMFRTGRYLVSFWDVFDKISHFYLPVFRGDSGATLRNPEGEIIGIAESITEKSRFNRLKPHAFIRLYEEQELLYTGRRGWGAVPISNFIDTRPLKPELLRIMEQYRALSE